MSNTTALAKTMPKAMLTAIGMRRTWTPSSRAIGKQIKFRLENSREVGPNSPVFAVCVERILPRYAGARESRKRWSLPFRLTPRFDADALQNPA